MNKIKIVLSVIVAMITVIVQAAAGGSVKLENWYEAHLDDEATTCMRWDDFWMGANIAIPVTGLDSPIPASDVVVTAGTYSEFGTPYVLTEGEMWNRYGAPVYKEKNLGNVEFDWYDNVWQNWDAEEDGAYGYELSADVWPNWSQVSGRQWILIPTGVPRLGTHTFSVKINGVKHDNYVVSFVMAEDQEPVEYGYQLSFNPNGGEVVEDNREVVAGKSVGTLPTPIRSKYKFLGWYTAPEGGTKISATTKVISDVTYYAQWVYDGSATVSVVVADGCDTMGKVTGGKTAKAGTKLTLKATANKGYVFVGWDGPIDESQNPRNPSISYVVGEDDAEFVAYFVPVGEDWVLNLMIDNVAEEYLTGEEISDIYIGVESGSLATIKVTGLSSGLKYTAKAIYDSEGELLHRPNTIYGTPKKSGVYTVTVTATTASKKISTISDVIVVRTENEKMVKPQVLYCFDDTGTIIVPGKVSGGGIFAEGKKLSLKATANKGFVFAGWLDVNAGTWLDSAEDYRNPNLSYVMTDSDMVLEAVFKPLSEDNIS